MDIISNFLALVVIEEFEDFLYLSLRDEPCKQFLGAEAY